MKQLDRIFNILVKIVLSFFTLSLICTFISLFIGFQTTFGQISTAIFLITSCTIISFAMFILAIKVIFTDYI